MLIVSLVLSGILLTALNVTAYRSRSIPRSLQWCALGLVGGVCLSPTFLLHAALSLASGVVCAWAAPRPRAFLATTLGAFFVAYGTVGVRSWAEQERVRQGSAPVSMAERLEYEDRPLRMPEPLPAGADVPLISMRSEPESPFDPARFFDDDWEWRSRSKSRAHALRQLHEHQVAAFVNSPGFGVTRAAGFVNRMTELPDDPPVSIDPSNSSIPPESAASLLAGGRASLDDSTRGVLHSLHRSSVIDFAYPAGFGYIRSRDRVYGFRPHRISKVPDETTSTWCFRNLELVSLLKHGKPAVYLSDHLPRMSELRHAATRPLDPFEAAALSRLAKDDLVVHATGERLRVLGSIRASEACLACHAGEKGRLLGAFSYTLDRPARE